MELIVKQKGTCWATFSSNINNAGTYAIWTNMLIFLLKVAIILDVSYLHWKQLTHFN